MPPENARQQGLAIEEILRSKLVEWQAKPDQIETIVGRFKS